MAHVVSEAEEMTTLVKHSGGRNVSIEIVFISFENKDRSYYIGNLSDYTLEVTYLTGVKGPMDCPAFAFWHSEHKGIDQLSNMLH